MGRAQFVVRRTLQLIVTLWAIATALFLLFRSMPGDPTSYVVDPSLSGEARDRLIESYGLNEPLYVQYLIYMQDIATLSFGQSFHSNRTVRDIILLYLPRTLLLMLTAFFFAYLIGITAGIVAGWRRGGDFEKRSVLVALVARSFPDFWVGLVVLWIFGAWLDVIPMSGMRSAGVQYESFLNLDLWLDTLWHLIAPAAVLGFYLMGYPLLLMRNSMLEVLSQDFIEVCEARGLKERSIMFKHAARNALLPVVTAGAVALGYAVGGSVLIETVFGWPGMGREMVNAVLRRDFPVAQGTFLVFAATVVFMNFLADLAYGFLDPRVTYD